jgi:NADH-quinone oxidoreductase E subunit
MLSEPTRQKIEALIARYPERRSALIPSLHLAQEETGWLSTDCLREVAQIFGLCPSDVLEVASFYTMFYKRPVGKYVVQVCTNISCLLCNSEQILKHLERRLGIRPGETTPDGRYTLLEVECLASCGTAPAVQINEEYHEKLTVERLDGILDGLK